MYGKSHAVDRPGTRYNDGLYRRSRNGCWRQCGRHWSQREQRQYEEYDDETTAMFARIQQHPDVLRAHTLAQEFQAMVRQRCPEALDGWLAACLASAIPELHNFAAGLQCEYASIRAALSEPWSTGQVEGQITRVKLVKRQMYGRAKFDLLKQRVLQRS